MLKRVGVVAVLVMTVSDAFGDWQTVKLKYEAPKDGFRYPTRMWRGADKEPPTNLKETPAAMATKHPVYFNIELGPKADELFAAALDESKGDGKGYDRAFVDCNRNGRMDSDEMFTAKNGADGFLVVGPVELRRSKNGKTIPWAIRIEWRPGERDPYPMTTIGFKKTGYAKLNGKRVRVGLMDERLNGRFGLRFQGSIILDEDVDGKFDMGTGESHILGKYFRYQGRFYRLQVDENGDWLKIDDAIVPVGKVWSECKDSDLSFQDNDGCLSVSTDSNGVAEVPVGTWWWYGYHAMFKQDGKTWRVIGDSQRNIMQCDVGTERTIRLPSLQFTPKLTATVRGREINFEFKLEGRWGEQVSNINQLNPFKQPPEPKLILSGPDGKVLASLDFKPG